MVQVAYSSGHATSQHEHNVKGSEIFIGIMSRSVTESMLHEVFAPYGEIVRIRIMKDQNGDSKGFGFVRFTTKEAAFKAVKEKDGYVLEGKRMGLDISEDRDSLFLGSLPKDWSREEFDKLVRQAFDGVLTTDLAISNAIGDSSSGKKEQNGGYGIVQFSTHSAAARAHKLGLKPDFQLGKCHPVVEWADKETKIDPEELAKLKVAFVGNLPVNADEAYLKKMFAPFGNVEKVAVSRKGHFPVGFIHFSRRSELDCAIKEMDGKIVEGPENGPTFKIQVTVAKPADKDRKRARDVPENIEANKSASRVTSLKDSQLHLFPYGNGPKVPQIDKITMASDDTDPYEKAVTSLPTSLAERLLKIFRLGIATRYDIDIQLLTNLKELPESAAILVLDEFMRSCSGGYSKGIQLAGLIARHQNGNLGLNPNSVNVPSRISDFAPMEAKLSSFPAQSYLTFDPLVSRARYDRPTLSPSMHPYSLQPSNDPLAYQSSIGRLSSSVLEDPLASMSSFGRPSSSVLDDHFMQRTALPQLGETFSVPSQTHISPISLASQGRGFGLNALEPAAGRPTERPQFKFDPFTGQPYKFDPFTGEPIRH